MAVRGEAMRTGWPSRNVLPRLQRVHAENRARQFGLARAHQTGNAQDLVLVHLEAHGDGEVGVAQVLDPEDFLARRGRAGRMALGKLLADHEADDLLQVGIPGRDRRHRDPVAQHGDAIADELHLFQLVGDVDEADAARLDVADGLEERLGLLAAERGRRLVHDEDFRVLGERNGDLEHLLLRDGEIPHPGPGVDIEVDLPQRLPRVGVHIRPADEAALAGEGGEREILGDAQGWDEMEVLVDRHDPQVFGRLGIVAGKFDRLAVEHDRPPVQAVGAGQDLHQGRLAGPVLAQQHVHLAVLQVEVDAPEHRHAEE